MKERHYTVWIGRTPGVYSSWLATNQQVSGFKGAKFKKFDSQEKAIEAFSKHWSEFIDMNVVKQKDSVEIQIPPLVQTDAIDFDEAPF